MNRRPGIGRISLALSIYLSFITSFSPNVCWAGSGTLKSAFAFAILGCFMLLLGGSLC